MTVLACANICQYMPTLACGNNCQHWLVAIYANISDVHDPHHFLRKCEQQEKVSLAFPLLPAMHEMKHCVHQQKKTTGLYDMVLNGQSLYR